MCVLACSLATRKANSQSFARSLSTVLAASKRRCDLQCACLSGAFATQFVRSLACSSLLRRPLVECARAQQQQQRRTYCSSAHENSLLMLLLMLLLLLRTLSERQTSEVESAECALKFALLRHHFTSGAWTTNKVLAACETSTSDNHHHQQQQHRQRQRQQDEERDNNNKKKTTTATTTQTQT